MALIAQLRMSFMYSGIAGSFEVPGMEKSSVLPSTLIGPSSSGILKILLFLVLNSSV